MSVQLNLTAAQAGDAAQGLSSTSQWRLEDLWFHRGWNVNGNLITPNSNATLIKIGLIGEYGRRRFYDYLTGLTADALLLQLNKLNLSTVGGSLEERVLNRLIADAKEAGLLAGGPD